MTREAKALAGALAIYIAWVAATYLLERLPGTFLRPEATALRLAYVGIANVALGIVLPVWLMRSLVKSGFGSASDFGFGSPARTLSGVLAGAVVGGGLFALNRSEAVPLLVFVNGFFQVWAVSVAETIVCWALVGGSVFVVLGSRSRAAAWVGAVAVAGVLFGVYHFAHSPPFDEPRMVLFLTGIGVVTGIWRFASRDVYGTAVFHNFFAVTGVLGALQARGALGSDAQFALPFAATAAAVTMALAVSDFLWIRRAGRS